MMWFEKLKDLDKRLNEGVPKTCFIDSTLFVENIYHANLPLLQHLDFDKFERIVVACNANKNQAVGR